MRISLPEAIVLCAIAMVVRFGFAQTWTQTSPNAVSPWEGIACSADGKVVMAIKSTAKPVVSNDSGNTWTTNASAPQGYSCIASSADGTKLVGAFFGSKIYLYLSVDSGNTWTQASASNVDWRAVASSADGSKLFAAGINTKILFSTNSGLNWQTSSVPTKSWKSLAASTDGTKLIGAGDGQIYISTNLGSTWQLAAVAGKSVATSADGSTLVVTGSGSTYVSTNSGSSWITNVINGNSIFGNSVASSADGKRLIVVGAQTYTSTNSGINWMTNNAPSSWDGVASSADGYRLFTIKSGGIWAGQVDPSPQLNLAPSETNLVLSWLVSSTNFVLQQNLDLTTTNWVTLTNVPKLNLTNLNNELTLPASSSSGFFRLMAQ